MKRTLVLLLVLSIATPALAFTNYVWTSGNNTPPYTSWGTAAHTIQAAINACPTNGYVMVASGTYLLSQQIEITNGVFVESYGGASATIINANYSSRCAYVGEGGGMLGFTLMNGKSGSGGNLFVEDFGGVGNCTITDGRAAYGGGVFAQRSGYIVNCTFGYNRAKYGGGAYLTSQSMLMACVLQNNTATNYGGGAYITRDPAIPGAGAMVCTFSDNRSRNQGGGAYVAQPGSVLYSCTLKGNHANTNGGGVAVVGGGGLFDCKILNNNANMYGGGIYSVSTTNISRCVIDNNSAQRGGGAYIDKSCRMKSCAILRNSADDFGGGVYSRDQGLLEACTIVSNEVPGGAGGGVYSPFGTTTGRFSICYFNTAVGTRSNYGGSVNWDYSCTLPVQPGNIGADPRFANKSKLDLRLKGTSPCIDALDPTWGTAPTDVRGVTRPLDGNNLGAAWSDMGAYERINRAADTDGDTFKDGFEVARDSDPTSAASLPYAYGDYDDDNISDLAVHERSSGAWFVRSLGPVGPGYPAIAFAEIVGGAGLTPVTGNPMSWDRCDLVAYNGSSGQWYMKDVEDGWSDTESWGGSGMAPVPGDYDGDGYFDLALYNESTGAWYIKGKGIAQPPITFGQSWGGPGLKAVPGDYDGDGVYDMALYETATGNWYIKPLGWGDPICFGQNWGGADMWPVAGDFNADGLWDLAVYQWSTGNWFIRSLGPVGPAFPPICYGQNWGGSGMTPVSGDFNGDGLHDLAAYQDSTGAWFIRSLGPVGPAYPPIAFGQYWGGSTMRPVAGAW